MNFVVCAGHGAGDPGAVLGRFTERDLMTRLRDNVCKRLVSAGHTATTDGKEGANLPLLEALPLIPKGDLAIELHVNAGPPTARGVESLSLPRLKPVAQALSAAIAVTLGTPVRGEKGWRAQEESARKKLAFVARGGIIVETFFLTNDRERETYLATEGLVADAIAKILMSSAKPAHA